MVESRRIRVLYENIGDRFVLGWRYDDVVKFLSYVLGALFLGDNRCDGIGMVSFIIIADVGS